MGVGQEVVKDNRDGSFIQVSPGTAWWGDGSGPPRTVVEYGPNNVTGGSTRGRRKELCHRSLGQFYNVTSFTKETSFGRVSRDVKRVSVRFQQGYRQSGHTGPRINERIAIKMSRRLVVCPKDRPGWNPGNVTGTGDGPREKGEPVREPTKGMRKV